MTDDTDQVTSCNVTERNSNQYTGMYVKLFTQILDSSIADNRRLRHFFTDLLLCSDAKGFVMMTDSALSRRIGADLDEVKWGLDMLQQPDPQSKTPDHDGRRIERVEGAGYGWRILNYELYRAMKDADQLREAVRVRVQRHRQKRRSGDEVECNGGNANTEGEGEADEYAEGVPPNPPRGTLTLGAIREMMSDELPLGVQRKPDHPGFDSFWHWYPNKQGKKPALKSWNKEKPDLDAVRKTLEWQTKSEQWRKGYIPLPATYLNQRRWEDEQPEAEKPQQVYQ